jgi:AAHS family 4-hydroxybenzoate transporter-like MFS transporter
MTSVQKDAAQAGVNVQTLLNEHPFSGFQWVIFALCFLIVLLDGFDTAAIGYIAPSLIGEWGVSKPALAPVLSAALFGLAAGAIFSGPLADRLGRKTVLVGSVAVFAVACLGSGFSPDIWTLAVLRFVTGLGLGAAMPNAVTLMSEYCPDARRATLTNAMFCGFPLGAAFGGFLAAWMIPHFGWRSVLILGGAAPLLLLVALVVLLPESVRHMVANHYPAERIRKVLARIAGDAVQGVQRFVMTESKPEAQASSGMGVVLSREYRVGSVMLWIAYFMGLVIFYALMNWMPVLFKEAGLDPIGYALTAASIWWIGQTAGHLGWLVVAVFLAGTIMNTAQSSMPALAAAFYPTRGRATGVAWMLGIGRFGGIAGSFLVAELSARHMGFSEIFAVVAIPGLIATAALVIKQYSSPEPQAGGAKPATPIH